MFADGLAMPCRSGCGQAGRQAGFAVIPVALKFRS